VSERDPAELRALQGASEREGWKDGSFHQDLEALLNSHSMEGGSDTPDFLLAGYLLDCLRAFDHAVKARTRWYEAAPLSGASDLRPPGGASEREREVLDEVQAELHKAYAKHPAYPSAHHGISVLREEVEELWEFVRRDRSLSISARNEALQIAATAIRYILDLVVVDPVRS
jgi:hypothetical protein